MASMGYDAREGVGPIIRAIAADQPAGVVEAAAMLHAATPYSMPLEGLHVHMWYLYATAQNLLQQSGLPQELWSVVQGAGALPEATIRYI
jgi:hypothetical protein